LVRDVFLRSRAPAPQVVIFSGAERATGCTWICVRAAETLASLGHGTVCLVDANLRSPSLHHYFHLNNAQGLAEALEKGDPLLHYVQYVPQSNLWVLTSGRVLSDLETLFLSVRLKDRITELRAYFKCVLIDTPPLSLYSDACHFGRVADGIVVVVEANSTQRETARSVRERLEVAEVPILAAVLNKQINPVPELIRRYL